MSECVYCAHVHQCVFQTTKLTVQSLVYILKYFVFDALSTVYGMWYAPLAEFGCVIVSFWACVCACTLSGVHLKSAGVVTAHLECHGQTQADSEDSCSVSGPPLIICLAVSVMTACRPYSLRVLQLQDVMWKHAVRGLSKPLCAAMMRGYRSLSSIYFSFFFLVK